MSKLKVLVSGIFYPLSMMSYFVEALQQREDVELHTCGPFTGDYTPWNFGMHIPQKYIYTPTVPLSPDLIRQGGIPWQLVENKLPDDLDLALEIDAGWHFKTKPKVKVNALVKTDPHVLGYELGRDVDITFSMQSTYAKPGDKYLPYAFSPRYHFPQDLPKETDGCLIGLHYENRNLLVDRLRKRGFKVHYSIGQIFDEYTRIYNQSRIALNWSTLSDLNARTFEGMAIGLPVLTNRVPDLSNFFVDGEHFVGFSDVNDAEKKFSILMADDAMREEIGQNAYRKVIAAHSYDHRIQQILETAKLV
jgi:hypothetical protein